MNSGCLSPEVVIFTDLDGTLLDQRYDYESAAYMLNALRTRGIYSIPATSKTAAELIHWQDSLTFKPPMIIENGAGVVWPEGALSEEDDVDPDFKTGKNYAQLCNILAQLRIEFGFDFRSFDDMTPCEISQATGLDRHAASLAKQRTASVPLSWAGAPAQLNDLRAQLEHRGLTLVRGGRFWHVMEPINKGRTALRVHRRLCRMWGNTPVILACGDSENDLPLLQVARGAVLFPKPDGQFLSITQQSVVYARSAGALAWLEAVNQLLHTLELNPQIAACGAQAVSVEKGV